MRVRYISGSVFAVVAVSVAVAVLVVLSGGSNIVINNAYAKYAPNTQTQAGSNDCDNGATCAITTPLIQGDESTNAATNTQNPEFNEEGEGHLAGTSEQPPLIRDLPSCNGCFASLTDNQHHQFENELPTIVNLPGINTIEDVCELLDDLTSDPVDFVRVIGEIRGALSGLNPPLPASTFNSIIECLILVHNIINPIQP
jgi:hypothetical protein